MAIYTTTLSAQNTNVYICDIVKPRGFAAWYANACASGTFGSGTVTFNISFDDGVTLLPITQSGTNVAASVTAAGCVNLKCAGMADLSDDAKLYASIATATNPSIAITVQDNR